MNRKDELQTKLKELDEKLLGLNISQIKDMQKKFGKEVAKLDEKKDRSTDEEFTLQIDRVLLARIGLELSKKHLEDTKNISYYQVEVEAWYLYFQSVIVKFDLTCLKLEDKLSNDDPKVIKQKVKTYEAGQNADAFATKSVLIGTVDNDHDRLDCAYFIFSEELHSVKLILSNLELEALTSQEKKQELHDRKEELEAEINRLTKIKDKLHTLQQKRYK